MGLRIALISLIAAFSIASQGQTNFIPREHASDWSLIDASLDHDPTCKSGSEGGNCEKFCLVSRSDLKVRRCMKTTFKNNEQRTQLFEKYNSMRDALKASDFLTLPEEGSSLYTFAK